MPVYDFEDVETGEHVEVLMSSKRAPAMGSVTVVGGRRLRRLVVCPSGVKVDTSFTSVQPARWHPDAPHHDHQGRAIFPNKQAAREFARKHADRASHQNYEIE